MPDKNQRSQRFEATSRVAVSQDRLFAYHAAPGALSRLIPPWDNVVVESSDGSLEPGSRVVLKMKVGPVPLRWVAVHGDFDPPDSFVDVQQSGPFAYWHHRHLFSTVAADPVDFGSQTRPPERSLLTDQIDYRLPLGWAGKAVMGASVRRQLETMFAYRHRVTREDLEMFDKYALPPSSVAVSGATGLVGTELCSLLGLAGHRVTRLVRKIDQATDPDTDEISGQAACERRVAVWHDEAEARRLEATDAVIHLAGKSIADQRWSESVKRSIRESRVIPTRQLCESLARLERPPATLICASATGIYGDRGDQWVDETSELGSDFLAGVGRDWEAACQPAVEAGIRVVHVRFGIVLSPRGGALAKLLTPTKLGLGGRLGSGKQWWSWVGIDDVVGAIYHALAVPEVRGPVNVVAPNPVTNAEFTGLVGSVLRRPTLLPAPAFALRVALGEMADALLLSSTRVRPRRLQETGYEFRQPDLRGCLEQLLGRDQSGGKSANGSTT